MKISFDELAAADPQIPVLQAFALRWPADQVTKYSAQGRKNNLLFLMTGGERDYAVEGGERFRLYKNEGVFFPIGSCYESRSAGGAPTAGVVIDFSLTVNGEPLLLPPMRFGCDEELTSLFWQMAEHSMDRLRLRSVFYRLLAELADAVQREQLAGSRYAAIARAIAAIEKNPAAPVNVAALSRQCCLSQTGFREQFRQYTGGLAPLAYRNQLRMKRADELLSLDSLSVERIAEMLGYYDAAHFCREYKKLRGKSPRGGFR